MRAKYWFIDQINEEKALIKEELDRVMNVSGRGGRLQLALRRIDEHAGAEEAGEQLRLYIYAISALVHHERYGGLTSSQVRRIAHLADAVIKLFRIKPGFSKLASLYADLQLVLSQIHRKEGRHWLAAWEFQLSHRLAPSHPAGGGFQPLAHAIRLARIGHSRFALSALQNAEQAETESGRLNRIRFEKILLLRLIGCREESAAAAHALSSEPDLAPTVQRELVWEEVCREAAATQNLSRMVMLIQPGKSHADSSYVLEASLWSKAVEGREWMSRVPKLPKPRKRELAGDHFFNCVRQCDACYDSDVPLATRLEQLGLVLADAHRVLTVDRELLVWAAAARWLARRGAFHFARLVLGEYEALSLRLSHGMVSDALGLMGDMLSRSWYLTDESPQL